VERQGLYPHTSLSKFSKKGANLFLSLTTGVPNVISSFWIKIEVVVVVLEPLAWTSK